MAVFGLEAVLDLDSSPYESGLNSASTMATDIIGGVARASAAAVAAAATGVATITTQAVSAYGQFEQMEGGIVKLFGDGADIVMENAANAFATSGRSANQYLEMVTSFSGSLIRDLEGDTVRAAELSDLALRDMSDNVNTYGTSMELVQNAYTGLMRQNYTMIDNLNLGFQGTAQGMADLINASGVMGDEFVATADNVKQISFDKYIEAIHEVQTQMNISGLSAEQAAQMVADGIMTEEEAMAAMGTTAREAQTTIQGSIGMTMAAWQNLITGLGDSDADLTSLVDNFVTSAMSLIASVEPVAIHAIEGISEVIEQLAPIVEDKLPGIIEETMPAFTTAIMTLINTVIDVLPTLIDTLLPPTITAATNLMLALVQALPNIIKILSQQLPKALKEIIPAILKLIPDVISAGMELILALGQGLADNADLILGAVTDVVFILANDFLTPDNIEQFVTVSTQIILTISKALIENAPLLIGSVIMIVANLIVALAESLPEIGEQIGNFIADLGEDLGNWLYDMLGDGLIELVDGLAEWWDEVVDFSGEVFDNFVELGADIIETIMDFMGGGGLAFNDGLGTILTDVGEWGADLIEDFVSFFDDILTNIGEWGADIIESVFDTFEDVKNTVSDAVDALIDFFDFDWELPDIKLPHFTMSGEFSLENMTVPSIGIEWYAKAMNSPMLLSSPTLFGMKGGRFLGGGEAGDEMIYGRQALLNDIREATNQTIIIPVYIGDEQIDEIVVSADQRNNFRSGGRA